MTRTALVIVASTRASRGEAVDRTGPLLRAWLDERGFTVDDPVVVADGEPVGQALIAGIAQGVSIVITTGGTGVSPTDATPEMTLPLIDKRLLGIEEELRRRGAEHVITALLSRGIVGVAGRTLVVNLPGSSGGVRDGLSLLAEILDHLLDQIGGGDHE
ncbi:molybdenum cofactor biosynthesis protein [Frondihabitans sp. PAMC 28766]|uniref:MogA/MoaB family molybdenum cofactor biosynthesis protein n=1 Tax=Frondihabitans sp. PAMC 28766 TaxID=1795630 RepID=UPI00078D5FFA|nr:MogA/MoaB family molybdenum cofactor biosynthesis protein [Frondihabitans sp. PAMC 28766]AMM20147.1 molybdenum cofactor biosynthesis protein [Frondihabitans sp. PAMC 28766]